MDLMDIVKQKLRHDRYDGINPSISSNLMILDDNGDLTRDPNEERILKIQNPSNDVPDFVTITPLEWAIYAGDKKMAALYFVSGANPEHNTIFMRNGVLNFDVIGVARNHQPIKGFEGLNLLVGETDLEIKALVWLMESLQAGSISLENDYGELAGYLGILVDKLQYSQVELYTFIMTSLCVLRQNGLTNDVALSIVKSSLMSHLWFLLDLYAKQGL